VKALGVDTFGNTLGIGHFRAIATAHQNDVQDTGQWLSAGVGVSLKAFP
jgi:hypothetical protein